MKGKRSFAAILSMVLCLQMLPGVSLAADETDPGTAPPYVSAITGSGVKVSYDSGTGKLTLYRLDGGTDVQMSKPAAMGYPIIGGEPVQDFAVDTCAVETDITGTMGTGERMTITSHSPSTGLIRIYVLETSDTVEGVIYTTTSYQAGSAAVTVTQFVENSFELYNPGNVIWSFNGGGEGPIHYTDIMQKINLADTQTYYRENIQNYTAAGIPISDIYAGNGGIAIGDASATRREVRTPVQETDGSASVTIKWPEKVLAANSTAEVGQSFISVHKGDYFNGLRGYATAMEHLNVMMPAQQGLISARSYESRWESWGWEFSWTVDLIINKLDELQAAGVKQITLDDGWYNRTGDWGLNPSKFPNGEADMTRLTQAIHDHGMTAILWWRPCDGGQNDATLYQQHPEYYVMSADGARQTLNGAGHTDGYGNFFHGMGYALCPGSAGAIASQTAFIDRAMNDWNFDGFKGDFVWSVPKCYDESHNHAYPEESTERQAELYQAARDAMVDNDPDCLTLLCNCGAPQDYYGLRFMTQIATADPTSLDQTRRRIKIYKALLGDYFPVTTDHNSVWYPSTVGTGAVMIEKRNFTGAAEAEYERWLDIADEVQLQKGRFVGDLYSYGFDPYETYVVDKDGTMYYAFYRDGSKYQPTGYPDIELKGLDPNKMYRIVDYVNDRVVATNLMGDNAVFNNHFSSYLLVKAVELTTPDPDPVDPDKDFHSVDAKDTSLVYTGTWHDDHNEAFYEETARYTNSAGASVEFSFNGTGIRWYGQRDTNFGTADVYLDGTLMTTVSANGSMAVGEILYEALDLTDGAHTIKVVCKTNTIDIDRFAYQQAEHEPTYVDVDALSDQITYTGNWTEDHNSEFHSGDAKFTKAKDASAEMTFTGTAVRWYGQNDTNFGTASVYIDDVLAEDVNVNGPMAVGKLLFEKTGLEAGEHTIRIVCKTPVIDIDYLSYGA